MLSQLGFCGKVRHTLRHAFVCTRNFTALPPRIGFTKGHEWAKVDNDVATVGITEFAQEQLGDIVFVELPDIGSPFARGDVIASVESVKAASDIHSPLSGTIIEVNCDTLDASPDAINTSAEENGWMVKLALGDANEVNDLMSNTEYEAFLKEEKK